MKQCSHIALGLLLFSLSAAMTYAASPGDSTFDVRYLEPYVSVIAEEGSFPASAKKIGETAIPIRLTSGETGSHLLIAVKAMHFSGMVKLEPLTDAAAPKWTRTSLNVRVIKMVQRLEVANRRRFQEGNERPVPEILLNDETEFEKIKNSLGPRGSLPLTPGNSASAPIGAGQIRYFIVTAHLPSDVSPGEYRCDIKLTPASTKASLRIPLKLIAVGLKLPQPDRYISISNDFGSPEIRGYRPVLKALSAYGINTTRIRDLLNHSDTGNLIKELKQQGYRGLIHDERPKNKKEARPEIDGVHQYFYTVDEPQPKRKHRGKPWDRMVEHFDVSKKIHDLEGRTITSLPYPLAMEMDKTGSDLFTILKNDGYVVTHEALDWGNYSLVLQHLERNQRKKAQLSKRAEQSSQAGESASRGRQLTTNGFIRSLQSSPNDLQSYITRLQSEYWSLQVDRQGGPLSKNRRIETYYFPLGHLRSAFLSRLLFGFYLFNSRMDGVMAWTLFRPKGEPFSDRDGPDAIIAFPTPQGLAATYHLEAVRDGVNDLRHCLLAERLLLKLRDNDPVRFKNAWIRFKNILQPYSNLLKNGRRIDKFTDTYSFEATRKQLVELIEEISGGQ